jgi:bacteriorhodopsin
MTIYVLVQLACEVGTANCPFLLLQVATLFVPFTSNVLAASGYAPVVVSASGEVVPLYRFICWMHTAHSMTCLLGYAAATPPRDMNFAVVCVETTIAAGTLASIVSTKYPILWALLAISAQVIFSVYLRMVWADFSRIIASVPQHSARRRMLSVMRLVMVATWPLFGIMWSLRQLDLVSETIQEASFIATDVITKVLLFRVLSLVNLTRIEQLHLQVLKAVGSTERLTVCL